MAKVVKKRDGRRKPFKDEVLPLSRENFIIIGIGLFVIVGGYAAMLFHGTIEGFLPLVVAPILLVLGYCVIIPLGILYRKSYIKHPPVRSGVIQEEAETRQQSPGV
jgi:hypothetical protein